MSANYDAILFDPAGRPTYFLMSAWRTKAPTQPLQPAVGLLEPDNTANNDLQRFWRAAFPSGPVIPIEPLAYDDGRGTVELWRALG